MAKKTKRKSAKAHGQPPSPAPTARQAAGRQERKDHVLQTRVPRSLYRELVDRARGLRVPVSNLVRNILEDSTRMVDTILEGGFKIAEALSGTAEERLLSDVLGWQPMIANRDILCSRCRAAIPKGAEAFVSVGPSQGRTIVICQGCKCAL